MSKLTLNEKYDLLSKAKNEIIRQKAKKEAIEAKKKESAPQVTITKTNIFDIIEAKKKKSALNKRSPPNKNFQPKFSKCAPPNKRGGRVSAPIVKKFKKELPDKRKIAINIKRTASEMEEEKQTRKAKLKYNRNMDALFRDLEENKVDKLVEKSLKKEEYTKRGNGDEIPEVDWFTGEPVLERRKSEENRIRKEFLNNSKTNKEMLSLAINFQQNTSKNKRLEGSQSINIKSRSTGEEKVMDISRRGGEERRNINSNMNIINREKYLKMKRLLDKDQIWCLRCHTMHHKDYHQLKNKILERERVAELQKLTTIEKVSQPAPSSPQYVPKMIQLPTKRKYNNNNNNSNISYMQEDDDLPSEDSFIVDDDDEELYDPSNPVMVDNPMEMLKKITGYNPNDEKYRRLDETADTNMDVGYDTILREERHTSRVGALEDLREFQKQQDKKANKRR